VKQIFEEIYQTDAWSNGSGPGSDPENAAQYLDFLRTLLNEHRIKRVLDVGCGDWRLYAGFDWNGVNYLGIDIVPNLIARNKHHSTSTISFQCASVFEIEISGFDLVILKDVLQHLPHSENLRVIERCRAVPWMLITNDFTSEGNLDCIAGGYRALNLESYPYHYTPEKTLLFQSKPFWKCAALIRNGVPEKGDNNKPSLICEPGATDLKSSNSSVRSRTKSKVPRKKILISSVHHRLFERQAPLLQELGYELITPTGNNFFHYGHCWEELGYLNARIRQQIRGVTNDELPSAGVDLVWCSCWAQLEPAILLSRAHDVPLLLYSCNNRTPYQPEHGTHLLSEDLITYVTSSIPFKWFITFPPDFQEFGPGSKHPTPLILNLIEGHERRYPNDFACWEKLKQAFPDYQFVHLQGASKEVVIEHLQKAWVLLHLKPEEASGNALMESLACGTPPVIWPELLQGRTCGLFLVPNFNALALDRDNMISSFKELVSSASALRENCITSIRSFMPKEKILATLQDCLNSRLRLR
jgi:SAM-dependent methyltransferase